MRAISYHQLMYKKGGTHVQYALNEQDAIGWDQFFKGRLSKEWQLIQEDNEYEHLRQQGEKIPSHQTGMWWTNRMIQLIIYFALNEWQVRNDTLHEKKEKIAREERRNHLKELTFKLYEAHRRADHKTISSGHI